MSGFLPDLAAEILGATASRSIRLATPFILHGLSAGLSANSILSSLTAGGLGVRRQTGLRLISALRQNYGYPSYLRGSKAGLYPPPSAFRPAAYPTKSRYTYVFRVTGRDILTGLSGTRFISISSNGALTSEDARGRAEDAIFAGLEAYALEPSETTLENVLVSPLLGVE